MAKKPKTNTEINGYKYFQTTLTLGKDEEGRQKQKKFYGTTKTEAENKKKAYLEQLNSGLNPDLTNNTLTDAMDVWLWEIEKISLKPSSFQRYESIYRNYIKGYELGNMTVSSIKNLVIQKHYNRLAANGKSTSQIQHLNKLLSKFFNYAVYQGYLIKNPCTNVKIEKKDEERVVETFSKDEIQILLNSLGDDSMLKYIIMFSLASGLRAGELLSLEKSDIKDLVITINKSVKSVKIYDSKEEHHYEMQVTKPKTKSSVREVPLPSNFKSELNKLDKVRKQEKLRSVEYIDNELMFPSKIGTHMDISNLRKHYEKALINAKIPYRKFHALRHTYATKLFEKGASLLTVSRLLGHSTTRTTEIYTHVLKDIKVKEVEMLRDLFI